MPKTMTWAWIKSFLGSEPSLENQGPLLAIDPDWKGSKYNVQVEWKTGEISFEPLSIIPADDRVTCAAYAKENDLHALERCIDSGALPRRIKSLQEQSSKVR